MGDHPLVVTISVSLLIAISPLLFTDDKSVTNFLVHFLFTPLWIVLLVFAICAAVRRFRRNKFDIQQRTIVHDFRPRRPSIFLPSPRVRASPIRERDITSPQ